MPPVKAPKAAPWVGGPGAPYGATGSFPLATCNAEFIGGGGLRNHIRIVPFCPSAQPQGGLSLPPPSWGRFFGLLRDARPEGGDLAAGAFNVLLYAVAYMQGKEAAN